MTTNKKTDATENYPWLVYSQDVDAIDGGGGGDSFGSLQNVMVETSMPEVGNTLLGWVNMLSISSGDMVYAQGNVNNPLTSSVAAGLTAVSFSEMQYTECDAYVCGIELNTGTGDIAYTSVAPWDDTVTVGSIEQFGSTCATYTLTVPELDYDPDTLTGECLVLYVHEAGE